MAGIRVAMRVFGIFLLIISAGIFLAAAYLNSDLPIKTLVFAPSDMLGALWQNYKAEYVESSTGRTLDKQRGSITTSEGQSYTMLRAVWMDDKETFDLAWNWTKKNLQREDDNLFSWLYGTKPNGTLGVLTEQNGQNTASDGDTDIALALIFAYMRWGQNGYLTEAEAVISDIWEHEVVLINNRPYLTANNFEKNFDDPILINPSYLAPYAYRIFSLIDRENDWLALVDTSYEIINKSIKLPLDKKASAGLPPDWVVIDQRNLNLTYAGAPEVSTNYGFDAMRLPWRLALDWHWYKEPRAVAALLNMDYLVRTWQEGGVLASTYTHDGQIFFKNESPAFYGANLALFMVADPRLAEDVYNKKLKILFDPDRNAWKIPLSYYDDNWAWFGMALYHGHLFNLSQNLAEKLIHRTGLNN